MQRSPFLAKLSCCGLLPFLPGHGLVQVFPPVTRRTVRPQIPAANGVLHRQNDIGILRCLEDRLINRFMCFSEAATRTDREPFSGHVCIPTVSGASSPRPRKLLLKTS